MESVFAYLSFSFALLMMLSAVSPGPASANFITVNDAGDFPTETGCTLRVAILSHNRRDSAGGNCEAGNGNDTIMIADSIHVIHLLSPVEVTDGTLNIQAIQNGCVQVEGAAYLTVHNGATVTLFGIGFDANRPGHFQRSVVENDGARLNIFPAFSGTPCRFSNEKRGRRVVSGGILVNRNDGTTVIGGADFADSSANPFRGQDSKGGAINIDSGTVTITETESLVPTSFTNDSADLGGAIFVNSGATLNIESNNFEFSNNRADQGGGAIFTNGKVNIHRSSRPFHKASFASNQAQNGAAIYSDGGQLSVDGVEFDHNESDGDGGALVSNELNGNVASIIDSYFHDNSAKDNGGAVYVVEGSQLDVRRSTFTGDQATGRGGGVFVNAKGKLKGNLKVVNSTFLGTEETPREGININGGLGEVAFSTISLTTLEGAEIRPGQLTVSNSILHAVICDKGVVDEGYNMQFQSSGCQNSIPTMNPDLDPKGLAGNGGPTPTIALLKDSPAIGVIPLSGCTDQEGNRITIDQRGFRRPAPKETDFCDIGAYEFQDLCLDARSCSGEAE